MNHPQRKVLMIDPRHAYTLKLILSNGLHWNAKGQTVIHVKNGTSPHFNKVPFHY
ncbi:hypothetical protein [Halobacillus trueperi]|uniref:hypothetical protein n=1 Tax=Halobacillus trueperi TaxID=156205 RepID=UPI00373697A7